MSILKRITRLFVFKIVKNKKVLCRTQNFACIFEIKSKVRLLGKMNGFHLISEWSKLNKIKVLTGVMLSFIGIEVI